MTVAHGRDHIDYRADIDGLRAAAVILVVLYHAFPDFCPAGFVGVDIFFVISGYLITGNILTRIGAGRFSYREFYARRLRRIVPALLVVLVATLAFGWLLLLPEEFIALARQTAGGATFTSNILLLMQAGYFDTASDLKPLIHLWSLGVEEQYYIVWPVILTLVYKTKLNKLAIFTLLGAASFAFMLAAPTVEAFYLLPARFWELLLGGALACHEHDGELPFRHLLEAARVGAARAGLTEKSLAAVSGVLAAILLSAALVLLNRTTPYPGANALLPTLAAVLIVASGRDARLNRRVFANRTMVTLGLISYPLYLWHWPLLSFARIIAGETPSIPVRLALLAASLVLAWLTWTLVEIPVRGRLLGAIQSRYRQNLAIGAAVAGLALVFAVSDAFVKLRVAPSRGPAFADLGEDTWYLSIDRMIADLKLTTDMCATGDNCAATSNPRPSIALYGDSHAEQLFPGFVSALPGEGWLLLSRPACPPVAHLNVREGDDERHCPEWNARATARLANDERIQTVVLASLATPYFDGVLRSSYSRDGAFAISSDVYGGRLIDMFRLGLSQTIKALLDAEKTVIFVIDNPELSFDPNPCARQGGLQNLLAGARQCTMPRPEYARRAAAYLDMVERIKDEFPQLLIYDPTNLICDRTVCSPWHNGRSLYRDQDHLSIYGSTFVADDFGQWLAHQNAFKTRVASPLRP